MSINLGSNNITLVNQGSTISNRGFLGYDLVYGFYGGRVYNTYIGAKGNTLTSETLLAAKLSVSSTDIQDFTIDSNNNISCNIYVDYTMNSNAFVADNVITYYLDLDGRCTFLNDHAFHNNTNLSPKQILVLPNVAGCSTSIFNGGGNGTRNKFGIICVPKLTPIGTSGTTSENNFSWSDFFDNVYVDSSNQTINAGSPDPDIASAITSTIGSRVRYSSNKNKPDITRGLNAKTITTNSVELEWSPITHTNTIDYYVVFANGNFVGSTSLTTLTIGTLVTGTLYSFKILAIDNHGNNSKFSDILDVTTL